LDGTKQVVKCRDNSFTGLVLVGCSPINVPIDSTDSSGVNGTLVDLAVMVEIQLLSLEALMVAMAVMVEPIVTSE